jgi:Mn-dependent DtxR family transcriptional regulator
VPDRQQKFAVGGLTHSAAHHLLAVEESIRQHGYARVSDVARLLGLTRGSVSVGLQSLKSAGYVEQDENRFFHLTDLGRRAAASLRARHEVVERFLTDVLGLTVEQSHQESCRVENLIGPLTARRLQALIDYWRENHLEGVLGEPSAPQCPVCGGDDPESCPCCGLAYVEGPCSVAGERG